MADSSKVTNAYIKYTTMTGHFHQDIPSTDPSTFDWTDNFGLIAPQTWSDLEHTLQQLNAKAPSSTKYKILFLGRHGQGYHNVAESYYGTKAWDCYYSLLDGNGTATWADARLTEVGIGQAKTASQVWSKALAAGLPAPQRYYSSPLTRCMQTAYYTFSSIPAANFQKMELKEMLRETIGAHTCDRRSTKTEIDEFWKAEKNAGRGLDYYFEDGFREEDELWDHVLRELPAGEDRRSVLALDDIFDFGRTQGEDAVWISISGHSGIIASLLRGNIPASSLAYDNQLTPNQF